MTKILLIPGDGIGPEVIDVAKNVLEAMKLDIEFSYAEAGFECYKKHGTSLPDSTIEACKNVDAVLFGAVTSPPHIVGYKSAILGLRKSLDLYANVRPIKSLGLESIFKSEKNIDMLIVRENTEDLYSGVERMEGHDRAITERIITRKASERIIRYAFELGEKRKSPNGIPSGDKEKSKVTLVHKANVMRATCGLFLEIGREIAKEYPDIELEEVIVDVMAMKLLKDPENFDIVVTTNLFGDILSDEACMLVGGLGVAASGNIGNKYALFEPVHGSAPDIAGQGIANPMATLFATVMMLEHLRDFKSATKLQLALEAMIKKEILTQDLGGQETTKSFETNLLFNLNN